MKNVGKINKQKCVELLTVNPHGVSLAALGLTVIFLKWDEQKPINLLTWMDEFGGGYSGHEERLFEELFKVGVLEREA